MVWTKNKLLFSKKHRIVAIFSLALFFSVGANANNYFTETTDTVFNVYNTYLILSGGDTSLITKVDTILPPKEAPKPETPAKLWKLVNSNALNFSQAQLFNWAAGGNNSIAGQAGIFGQANYNKDKISWENTLDLQYGMARQEIKTDTFQTIKTSDKIDFTSSFGMKASKKWFYSAQLNFKTQFDKGYEKPDDTDYISDFMAPGYMLGSIGMDYKPSDKFKVLISPFTGKFTFVYDELLSDAGAFGVDPGKNLKSEVGGFVKFNLTQKLFKNTSISTQLDLFSSYSNKPENIDINWIVKLDMKINDYLSADINANLMYDDDVIKRIQFMEVFSIGFKYKIESK